MAQAIQMELLDVHGQRSYYVSTLVAPTPLGTTGASHAAQGALRGRVEVFEGACGSAGGQHLGDGPLTVAGPQLDGARSIAQPDRLKTAGACSEHRRAHTVVSGQAADKHARDARRAQCRR